VFSNFFSFKENHAIYEKMWKNIVEWGRPHMTIWCMCIACWIPEATNTHSGCVILIAFSQQQCLHECASVLRYTYIACLVCLRTKLDWCANRQKCWWILHFSLIIWGHFLTHISNEILLIYIVMYIKLGFKEVIGQLQENFA